MTRTPLAAALAALALTLTAGTALAATGHATRDVNVRAGAGTSYAVIGTLEAGDEVEILGCGGGWCATDEGYVAAAYLAIAADGGDNDEDDDEDDEDDDGPLDEDGQFDEDPLGLEDDVPQSIFSGFDH